MTKPITSIAFMMLVEEGKVALSDPLVKFCPEFKDTGVFVAGGGNVPFLTRPPTQPIRMVDLLRHTAGLTYGFPWSARPVDAAYRKARIDDFDADYTMDGFIADLAKIPLQFDPGAHWNYSMATDVLGAVIERIEGKPFGAGFAGTHLRPARHGRYRVQGPRRPAAPADRCLCLPPRGQEAGFRRWRAQSLGEGPQLSFGRRRPRLDAAKTITVSA